jgi:hypothetical protein
MNVTGSAQILSQTSRLRAYLLSAALDDASFANLLPEAGLYACLFSGLFSWVFCG